MFILLFVLVHVLAFVFVFVSQATGGQGQVGSLGFMRLALGGFLHHLNIKQLQCNVVPMSCIRIAIHNAMHGNLKAAMQSSPLLCVTIQCYVILYISNISVVPMLCYAFQSVMPQCNPAQFYVLQPQAKLKN